MKTTTMEHMIQILHMTHMLQLLIPYQKPVQHLDLNHKHLNPHLPQLLEHQFNQMDAVQRISLVHMVQQEMIAMRMKLNLQGTTRTALK